MAVCLFPRFASAASLCVVRLLKLIVWTREPEGLPDFLEFPRTDPLPFGGLVLPPSVPVLRDSPRRASAAAGMLRLHNVVYFVTGSFMEGLG